MALSIDLSVKSTRCDRARPLASRILAEGYSRTRDCAVLCQGLENLTRVRHSLCPEQSTASKSNSGRIQVLPRGAVHLSHGMIDFDLAGTKRSKKSLSVAFYVHTGAEGQQSLFRSNFAGADCLQPVERETTLPAPIACAGRKAGFSTHAR